MLSTMSSLTIPATLRPLLRATGSGLLTSSSALARRPRFPRPQTQALPPPTATRSFSSLPTELLLLRIGDSSAADLALPLSSATYPGLEPDLDAAVRTVRNHDPSGYLPGLLLPTVDARIGYFAARSFWVETGLRKATMPVFGGEGDKEEEKGGGGKDVGGDRDEERRSGAGVGGYGGYGEDATIRLQEERLRRWRRGIESVFSSRGGGSYAIGPDQAEDWTLSPTLRLLRHILLRRNHLSPENFTSILNARMRDLRVNQYDTVQDVVAHSSDSCGGLLRLVLECCDFPAPRPGSGGVDEDRGTNMTIAHKIAREIGILHGLSNALRTSVSVLSTTGKCIVPADLCLRYGVRSPRYLLSALALGDEECRRALQSAVGDLVGEARGRLESARGRRDEMYNVMGEERGRRVAAAFLVGIPAESFLDRLERGGYDLSDMGLRNVGLSEHFACSSRLMRARWEGMY